MDCQSLYDEFADKALADIKLSKKFAGVNEFNSGFLFGTDDCNCASMKQMQRNWAAAAPGLFADFARKLASGHSIETFDLPSTSRWKNAGFGYSADGGKHACVMLWPSIDHSPLNHTKSNSMFWAFELVENGEVDDVYLVWLADEANVKLRESLGYWYESFSPRGVKHVFATDWFERTFGKEGADRLTDVAGRVRTEGRLVQGFTVVALPTEHELGSFRRELLHDYEAIELPLIRYRLMGRGMSERDIDILARNIQRKDLFEILFGQASFAVSFLSSEWRYRLNTLSENVEQTGTVAGYIKAIEQMMFDLLPLWANRDYKVAFGAVKAWNPAVPLTSALLAEKDKEATLGPLAYLFASYQHKYFNVRIYDPEIDYKSFRELLFGRLRSFMDDTRNGKLVNPAGVAELLPRYHRVRHMVQPAEKGFALGNLVSCHAGLKIVVSEAVDEANGVFGRDLAVNQLIPVHQVAAITEAELFVVANRGGGGDHRRKCVHALMGFALIDKDRFDHLFQLAVGHDFLELRAKASALLLIDELARSHHAHQERRVMR